METLNTVVFTAVISGIVAIVTVWLNNRAAKRGGEADIVAEMAEAAADLVAPYQATVAEMQGRIETMGDKIDEIEAANSDLMAQVRRLVTENERLAAAHTENARLIEMNRADQLKKTNLITGLAAQVLELKAENEALRLALAGDDTATSKRPRGPLFE